MAETFTDNLKLSKRDTGDLNWGAGANTNLDVVDGHAQLKNLRPPRTLIASLGSGGVGANLLGITTYFYKITAINELGETTENKIPVVTEAQITEPASPVPIILSWETVPGATGYKIYKGTSANAELFLTQVAGGASATFTDTGNTVTQAGQNVPATNAALLSVTGIRKLGEAAPLRGDVKLEAGPNVVLTQDPAANKIKIEATSSGGVTSLRKEGDPSGLTGDVKLRAGTNIALTQETLQVDGSDVVAGIELSIVADIVRQQRTLECAHECRDVLADMPATDHTDCAPRQLASDNLPPSS